MKVCIKCLADPDGSIAVSKMQVHLRAVILLHFVLISSSLNFCSDGDVNLIHSFSTKGSWSLKFERGSGLVCIMSTLWPGLSFYHVPHSQKFGYVYFGTGEKNKDLPFLL